MTTTLPRIVAGMLVLSLLALSSGLSAKERRGATLVITKLDGARVRGELIAVKPESLLLLTDRSADASVALADIREVRVIRRSHALLFATIGGAASAIPGALVGLYTGGGDDDPGPATTRGAVVYGAAGALVGLLVNSWFSADPRFDVAGARPEAVAKFWERLRSRSREGRLPRR